MIEFSTIEALIMAYAPLVVTILGIVFSFIKIVAAIKNIRADNKLNNEEKDKQIQDIKNDLQAVVNQNYNLKKQINELLTKLDNVKRE